MGRMVQGLTKNAGELDLENGPEPREAQQLRVGPHHMVLSAMSLLSWVTPERVMLLVGVCVKLPGRKPFLPLRSSSGASPEGSSGC